MLRLLLLIPTSTYRTADFLAAAEKLDVEIVVASDRPNVLEGELPDNLLTLDFAEGVNVTLGLGRIRTSPDHGPAYDLAWQGRADATSMRAAIALADQMATRDRGAGAWSKDPIGSASAAPAPTT